MVEATDFANRDDLAEFRPLNWAAVGRILVEREVSTRPVVVREVTSQEAAQVPFAKDEEVIQVLAPDGADEPLREGVLPGAVGRREDFTDAHALHALPEHVTVDRVAIAEEVGRGGVVREGVHDLLGRPGSGGMLRRILVEREMRASPVIAGEVAGQDAAQVAFAKNQNVIQTFAPDRADEPLREGILPRAVRRREDFLDPHALHAVPKLLAVDLVTVAQEIGGRGVVREGLHDLLGGPVGGGTVKKSRATTSRTWLARNVRQV